MYMFSFCCDVSLIRVCFIKESILSSTRDISQDSAKNVRWRDTCLVSNGKERCAMPKQKDFQYHVCRNVRKFHMQKEAKYLL